MNSQETNIVRRIMLRLGSIPGVRIFRNNIGKCWIGKSIMIRKREQIWLNPGDVVVQNARYFEAGLCPGSSDLIGFRSVEITPEMVGKKVAIFTAFEVKTLTGKASGGQINFINMVNTHGGIGVICRDENEAEEFITK